MRDQPQSADLLTEARRTLVSTILPALSSETRYQTLMVVKALEIAERELRSNRTFEANLGEQFRQLIKSDDEDEATLAMVSKKIRNGYFDQSDKMYELLRLMVTFKLMETDPDTISDELLESLKQHQGI